MSGPQISESRAWLMIRLFRFLSSLGSYVERNYSHDTPSAPAFRETISSKSSAVPGKIDLIFYTPSNYVRPSEITKANGYGETQPFPLVVNFHGGGYSIGGPQDDARWSQALTRDAGALVVSVGYRLAPECPFPTGIEDCMDAILHLWSRASEYNIDPMRTILSGFSAGGNFSVTVPYRLYAERQEKKDHAAGDPEVDDSSPMLLPNGKLVGIIPFYPALDWTKSRQDRTASNPVSGEKSPISQTLYMAFDFSYLGAARKKDPKLDTSQPLLSPGLAPDELIKAALPQRVALFTCEWDQLLVEGEMFRDRLQKLGIHVVGWMVPKVVHGWDKYPKLWWQGAEPKRDQVYDAAVKEARVMFGLDSTASNASLVSPSRRS